MPPSPGPAGIPTADLLPIPHEWDGLPGQNMPARLQLFLKHLCLPCLLLCLYKLLYEHERRAFYAAFDVLDALVRGGNGVLRTADAVAAGITRPVLGNYVRERDLERVGHGLYLAPDAWKDGMYLLHLRCPQAVFSHDTALFLHDLTDREPLAYTVTVKSGYNPHRLKGDGVKVYRIKAELHGLGLSQTNTPFGNPVAVYDLERTVCDVVRSRSGMDVQVLRDTLRRYAAGETGICAA